MKWFAVLVLLKIILPTENCGPIVKLPVVINTWGFTNATNEAWNVVKLQERSAVRFKCFYWYFIGPSIDKIL